MPLSDKQIKSRKKEKIKSKTGVKALTVFQEFANWLAIHCEDRDEKFEVTISERAIVIIRIKLPELKS